MKHLAFPTGKLTEAKGKAFTAKLRAAQAAGTDILIKLDSEGGDVETGFKVMAAINEIKASGHQVHIHVTGGCESMAAIILQSATRRTIESFGFLMLHETRLLMSHVYDSKTPVPLSQVYSDLMFYIKQDKQMCELMDERSGKKKGYWYRRTKGVGDLQITAADALKEGLVDEICSIISKNSKAKQHAIEATRDTQ